MNMNFTEIALAIIALFGGIAGLFKIPGFRDFLLKRREKRSTELEIHLKEQLEIIDEELAKLRERLEKCISKSRGKK